MGLVHLWRWLANRAWPWLWPVRSYSPTTIYVSPAGHDYPWRTSRDPHRPLRTLRAAATRCPSTLTHRFDIVMRTGRRF